MRDSGTFLEKPHPGVKIAPKRKITLILLSQIPVSLLSSFEANPHPQFVALSESITGTSAAPLLAGDIFFLFL